MDNYRVLLVGDEPDSAEAFSAQIELTSDAEVRLPTELHSTSRQSRLTPPYLAVRTRGP